VKNGHQPEAGDAPKLPSTGSGVRAAIDDIEFKIARLDLRPGDVLVVKCQDRLTTETVRHMQAVIKEACRGHRALILERGMDLAILSAAEIEARSTAPTSDEAAV
jgi:hypothetical protein